MHARHLLLAATALLALALPSLAQQAEPDEMFKRMDRNGDGKLTREELPPRARQLFDRIDRNRDGAITPDEHAAFRQRGQRPGAAGQRPPLPKPDLENVKYGPHERNVFDLWKAKSEKPAPLVIYYHGGGFRGGDKRTLNPMLLQQLLASGISVAAANYRLTGAAPFPAQMHDCARALQLIRHNAKEYGIDPKRVGATGGSAGAGISQWLAFHDDLADPKSEDPVARQSTRLTCAVVYAAQSSYDPRFIKKLMGTDQVDGALLPFFGLKSPEDVSDAKFHPLFEEASPINHATADDPPVMLFYPQANQPLPPNSPGNLHIHHPKFGFAIKEKLDQLGVECILKLREDYPELRGGMPVEDYVKFFKAKLGTPQSVKRNA